MGGYFLASMVIMVVRGDYFLPRGDMHAEFPRYKLYLGRGRHLLVGGAVNVTFPPNLIF
jgi:hypothetical protein